MYFKQYLSGAVLYNKNPRKDALDSGAVNGSERMNINDCIQSICRDQFIRCPLKPSVFLY